MLLKKLKEPGVLRIIIPLAAAAIISRSFPLFGYFYYLAPIMFLWILFAGYEFILEDKTLKRLLTLILLFGLWCGVTSSWSDYPLISLSRSGYFLLIASGALLGGYSWQQINHNPLSFLLPANIIVIALSLFSLMTNIPADGWTGGNEKGFMGFAGHQNTLASAILFTLPGLLGFGVRRIGDRSIGDKGIGYRGIGYKGIRYKAEGIAHSVKPGVEIENQKSKIKIRKSKFVNHKSAFLYMLLFLNLLILLFTYSRASMFALICGTIILLILTRKWKLLLYSFSAAVLILFVTWFSPVLKEKADELVKKDFPQFYSSREWLWVPSYKAALSGGLTGLGYGISNPEIIVPGTGSHYEGERYIREKGNSILALIEETGLIGLVLFDLPLLYIIRIAHSAKGKRSEAKRKEHSAESIALIDHPVSGTRYPVPAILASSLAAFLIHSQFEGWIVGVGSIQLPLFFFYVGSLIYNKTV